jgi:hypothetical protein
MKTPFLLAAVLAVALSAGPLSAQTTSTTVTTTTASGPITGATAAPPAPDSVTPAFQAAQNSLDPSLRNRVVSVYGTGTPAAIDKWYFIFFDPSVDSHGRAVLVENNQVVKSYPAAAGVVYPQDLVFDPTRVSSEGPALQAAQNYAAQHAIAYNHVRALLRMTSAQGTFRWRVQLMEDDHNRGFVFVNANDGSVAMYSAPGTVHTSSASVEGQAERAAHDVKDTFLGIGGDLQQFFTGERTIDR